jgi:DNA-binding LytR/AlgR family response regulator
MKIVIIEDELLTAEDLAEAIRDYYKTAEIDAPLTSVKDSITYFKQNSQPDLIFCDIQLADGHSFEIFKQIDLKHLSYFVLRMMNMLWKHLEIMVLVIYLNHLQKKQ